jgi:uncharacterized protein (TIGR00297 family)
MKHIANFAQMRIKGLSSSGTLAAIAVGAGCAAAGWKWLALLLVFYISSTLLSRYRRESKRLRSRDIVEKSGDRDMWQVAANGGVFAALALASVFHPAPGWYVAAVGALAASTADTWSTEIGMLARQTPRSIVSFRRVPPGTSGGVTFAGLIGGVAGALLIGIAALSFGGPTMAFCAALAGGVGGSLIDSILGATIQSRRWCATCNVHTEQHVHVCGTETQAAGGIAWLGNDLVNLFCSFSGALLGYFCLA